MKKYFALLTAILVLALTGTAFAADVSVSASPTSVTVLPGGTGTATISATPANGGTIVADGYSVSGASWASLSGTTLTFTVPADAAAGSQTATVTATERYLPAGASAGHPMSEATGTVTVTATVPALTLTASDPANVVLGGSTTVTLTPGNASSAAVTYASTVSGAAANVTFSGNTATITPTAAGTSTVTITATNGARIATATVTVTTTLPALSLAASPTTLSITAGESATATLTPTNVQGTASYAADVSWVTFSGTTATFNPPATLAAGEYPVVITLTDSDRTTGNTATATVTVTVAALPALALAAEPTTLSIQAGGTATATLTPTNLIGTASYAATVNGSAANWVTFSGTTVTFNPPATLAAGEYPVVITLTDSGRTADATATATVTVTVSALPLSLAANPTTLSITAGGTATAELTATNLIGTASYAADVNWASVSGTTVTFSPSTTLTPGTYPVVITLTDGGRTTGNTATATVNVTVTPMALGLSVTPTTLTVQAGGTSVNATLNPANLQGTATYYASENWVTFSGNTATFAPGPTVTAGNYTITLRVQDSGRETNNTANTTITVTVTAPPLSVTASPASFTDIVEGQTVSSTFTPVNLLGNASYTASESWVTFLQGSSTAMFNTTGLSAGPHTVTITLTDEGRTTNATATVVVTVNVIARPALTLEANPAAVTITTGSTGLVAFTPSNAVGTVTYSANPSGNIIVIFNGNAATFNTANVTTPATYPVVITATDGGRTIGNIATITVNVTVTPPALTLAADPATLTIQAGQTNTSALTPGNVQGTVSYTATSQLGVEFSGNAVIITPSANMEAGTYPVEITATDSGRAAGSNTITTTIYVTVSVPVPPLEIAAAPETLNLFTGGTGTVSLSSPNAIGIVSYTSSPAWATFSGSTATLTAPAEAGTYTVTFTGTDAGRTENRTGTAGITLIVTSQTTGGDQTTEEDEVTEADGDSNAAEQKDSQDEMERVEVPISVDITSVQITDTSSYTVETNVEDTVLTDEQTEANNPVTVDENTGDDIVQIMNSGGTTEEQTAAIVNALGGNENSNLVNKFATGFATSGRTYNSAETSTFFGHVGNSIKKIGTSLANGLERLGITGSNNQSQNKPDPVTTTGAKDFNEFTKRANEKNGSSSSNVAVAGGDTYKPKNKGVTTVTTEFNISMFGHRVSVTTVGTFNPTSGGGRMQNYGRNKSNVIAAEDETQTLDLEEDGSSILLNSAGNRTDHVPDFDEWETPAGESEPVMLVPGYAIIAVNMLDLDAEYTPIITTPLENLPTEALESGVSDATSTIDSTTEVEVQIQSVPVIEDVDQNYSTEFTDAQKNMLKTDKYKITIGRFIITGENGVWSATETEEAKALLTNNYRKIVQTLPKIRVYDENDISNTIEETAQYALKMRYKIPKDTTTRIISGDSLLKFYSNGLVTTDENGNVSPTEPAEAKFLKIDGTELTDENIMDMAKGSFGEKLDDDTQYYDGFIVMTLDRSSDDIYTPVVTVQRMAVATESPDVPDEHYLTLTLEPTTTGITVYTDDTYTFTVKPGGDYVGDVNYDTSYIDAIGWASWSQDEDDVLTIKFAPKPANAGESYTVIINAVDDEGHAARNPIELTVTARTRPTTGPGSSGGGCSAGFSALALAVLGTFIAKRKK